MCGLLLGAGLAPPERVGELTSELLKTALTHLQTLHSQGVSVPPSRSGDAQQLLAAVRDDRPMGAVRQGAAPP